MARLDRVFKAMGTLGASDIILSADMHPLQMVQGEPQSITNFPELSADELETHLYELVSENQRKYFINHGDLCFGYELAGSGRYRVSFSRAMDGIAAQVRYVPEKVKQIDKLGLDDGAQAMLKNLVPLKSGLVLIASPNSCGKSTTAAALIHAIAHHDSYHVVCLEKPTEFVHKDSLSIVTHRDLTQLEVDEPVQIDEAFSSAMRGDVDVVYIADLSDVVSARTALEAAASGKLVLAGLAAKSFSGAIRAIEKHFTPEQLPFIHETLGSSLEAIFLQDLVQDSGEAPFQVPVIGGAIMNEAGRKAIQDQSFHGWQSEHFQALASGSILVEQAYEAACQAGLTAPGQQLHVNSFDA